MCENQTSWDNREQQVTFGRMIGELLRLKFGRILNADCQGGGEIATLVITGHNIGAKKMEEMRDFLIKTYELSLHKIKNHGHTAGTIVVHISEITNTSRKIIEDDFHLKIILPKSIENKKSNSFKTVTFAGSKTNKRKTVFVNKEITKNQNENQEKMEEASIVQRGRRAISVFMTMMFKFEGIMSDKKDKIFSFDEKKTDDCQVISFRNEHETELSHKALIWYFSNAKEMPVLGNKEIMVDFSALSFEKTRPANVSFCLPPLKGENSERIKVRSMHLFTGYKPSSVYVIDENTFSIGYSKPVTTQKFFELISGMGWEPSWQDDLIICKFRVKPEVAIDDTNAAGVASETEEISTVTESSPEGKEVVPEPNKKVLSSSFVSPRDIDLPPLPEGTVGFIEVKPLSIKDLFSQAEAIQKFKEIYNDDDRWKAVPSAKKEKIMHILRNDLRSSEPQVFATYLLELSSENRPLFSKEEAVAEFKLIMADLNFKHLYSLETQNRIISAMKDNLSDDELLDGLLDLF